MILWEVEYTQTCELWVDREIDYFWSVKPPTLRTVQTFWDRVDPGTYTISDLVVREANLKPGESCKGRLLERVYTDTCIATNGR